MRRQRIEPELKGTTAQEGIILLDERNLPGTAPSLQLLLARDRSTHVIEHLEMNEPMHVMALSEAFERSGAMLMQPRQQIGRHADVKRAVPPAGKDVDARLPRHFPKLPRSWVLNQVQHDVMGPA